MSTGAPTRVYLHVGSPKTGTTYLQEILWNNRTDLRHSGVLYPGKRPDSHFHAAMDLQEKQFQHDWFDENVPQAWNALVEEAAAWTGTVVISHELFCTATPEQVERAMRDLSFAEVHLVCTARDLLRQLPAVWQEDVKNRHTLTFEDFVSGIRGTASETNPLSELFWPRQDTPEILARWAAHLPPERVHVVTVPPKGNDPDTVWYRFAELIGVDPQAFDTRVSRPNRSLGVAETEVLRRLNQRLEGHVSWGRHDELVKSRIAADLLGSRKPRTPIEVPEQHRQWLNEQAERIITELGESDYHVVGDLAELRPSTETAASGSHPDQADPEETTEVAVEILAELVYDPPRSEPAPPPPQPRQPAPVGVRRSLVHLCEQHPLPRAALTLYRRVKGSLLRTRGR
ncbi:hypothetical protein [Actinopolyspora mortivallis]|uniref:Sulfotransferase family protein n=1 Tax=Actinopolyspora mortivallis TaxID=33906 RepID=A0A2T0GUD4_ACTMO|nr:hypothetical protein [Actinopolyspora mortivallis]PRW62704.1 hypothetical protein CEP50_13870 [Actinopolyspora mortivallis]